MKLIRNVFSSNTSKRHMLGDNSLSNISKIPSLDSKNKTVTDEVNHTKNPENNERTVFILYIPGGAMLGMIPALVLQHLEQITEMPTSRLFQVFDGVSTGSILSAGLNIRETPNSQIQKISAEKSVEFFSELGKEFFPYIPRRMQKMWAANLLNLAIDRLDPHIADAQILSELNDHLDHLKTKANDKILIFIDSLSKLTNKRWLTKDTQKQVLTICENILKDQPGLAHTLDSITDSFFARKSTTALRNQFKKASLFGVHFALKNFANGYLFDSKVAADGYRSVMGDQRIGESIKSVYISAYDIRAGSAKTFFSRKADFFSTDPSCPTVTSEYNHKLWDTVMASTAHPLGYPAHITEDGNIYSDKANIHTPLTCIQDVLKHKPADAKVKFVVLGTGHYLSSNNEIDAATHQERSIKYGVAGNLLSGNELAEWQQYSMSMLRKFAIGQIGKDNYIELIPRMSRRNNQEELSFPSRNIMDASQENIEKIANRAIDFIAESDEKIRDLARNLSENLFAINQMSPDKYERVMERLSKPCPFESKRNWSKRDGIIPETVDTIKRSIRSVFTQDLDEENLPPSKQEDGLQQLSKQISTVLSPLDDVVASDIEHAANQNSPYILNKMRSGPN
jgi:hypothetical protein